MAFDTASGRLQVGLLAADATQDVQIAAAMSVALAYAENYCDRNFLFKRQIARKRFTRFGEDIFMDRYPIGRVYAITYVTSGMAIASTNYFVHAQSGIVDIHQQGLPVDIDYDGGFKALPADLEYALWKMFGVVWADFDPAAGGGVVAAGPSIGAVKKQTIVGVGSIDYETGSAPATAVAGVAADLSAVMPGAVQATLDSYARRVA
jgi:hypothetical protein